MCDNTENEEVNEVKTYDREIQITTMSTTVSISTSCKEDTLPKLVKIAEKLVDKYSHN